MVEAWFAVPGELETPTGGYAYARAILARFPAHGITAHHLELPGSYPFPDANDLAATEALLSTVPKSAPLLIDGLAYGALPAEIAAQIPQPIAALVHHPLALETGLTPTTATRLRHSERLALQYADAVISTSATTAATLQQDYDVPAHKLTVAEPGAPRPRRAEISGAAANTVALLAVGAISPRKGYDCLVAALGSLGKVGTDADWRLTIVGALDRAGETANALRAQIGELGLSDRIELAGAVSDEDLEALFHRADLFVHAARYEGYGMVLTEALSRGLPIVATTGGAAAETLPDHACVKVPPDDVAALSKALGALIGSAAARSQLSEAAWAAAKALPSWDDTTAAIAGVLKGLSHERV